MTGSVSSHALALHHVASLDSPRSQQTARESLVRVCRLLDLPDPDRIPWSELGRSESTAARQVLRQRLVDSDYALSTVRVTLSTVRGVIHQAWRQGLLTSDEEARAVEDLRPPRGSRLGRGRVVGEGELEKLLETAHRAYATPLAELARAVLLVGLGTGLRRAELCSLRLDAVDVMSVRAIAKGNREVRAPLSPKTRAELDAWLSCRVGLGWEHPFVFVAPFRPRLPLSPWRCARLLRQLCLDAGVPHLAMHDLRRTFGTKMVQARGLRVAQRLLHHASPDTTAGYDMTEQAEIDKARAGVEVW